MGFDPALYDQSMETENQSLLAESRPFLQKLARRSVALRWGSETK